MPCELASFSALNTPIRKARAQGPFLFDFPFWFYFHRVQVLRAQTKTLPCRRESLYLSICLYNGLQLFWKMFTIWKHLSPPFIYTGYNFVRHFLNNSFQPQPHFPKWMFLKYKIKWASNMNTHHKMSWRHPTGRYGVICCFPQMTAASRPNGPVITLQTLHRKSDSCHSVRWYRPPNRTDHNLHIKLFFCQQTINSPGCEFPRPLNHLVSCKEACRWPLGAADVRRLLNRPNEALAMLPLAGVPGGPSVDMFPRPPPLIGNLLSFVGCMVCLWSTK